MVDLQPRLRWWVPLCGLDAGDLELEEKLGHLDGKVSSDRPDTSLGGQVHVELTLEGRQAVGVEWCLRRELAQGELQWCLRRLGKVDGREGYAAR